MIRHFRASARDVGRTLHLASGIMLTILVGLTLLTVAAAWRLSQGPVALDFLKNRIEQAVNRTIAPARISMGTVSVAWRGFSHGVDQPLVLRVTDLTVEQSAGLSRAQVPVIEAALSARALLGGRVVPRALMLEGARLSMLRAADGSISLDLGDANSDTAPGAEPSPLTGLLRVFGAPAESDTAPDSLALAQLTSLSIRGAVLVLDDRRLGVTWSAPRAEINLVRRKGGGVDGTASIRLRLGDRATALDASFKLAPAGQSAHVVARVVGLVPKALAAAVPAWAPLAALDATIALDGEADLGPDMMPVRLRLTARAGAGKAATGAGAIPFQMAAFTLAGTLNEAVLDSGIVELLPKPGAPVSTLRATGQLSRGVGRTAAKLHLTLDRVGFADLALLWPADIARNAQTWMTRNVLGGTAKDGKADLDLEMQDDTGDVTLTRVSAAVDGEDVVATWLPTVPPVDQGRVRLTMTDPDRLEFDVRSGRQTVRGGEPILLRNGHISIAGISRKDQVASIRVDVNGSILSAIALLKEPRLRILDRHPMDLKSPSGEVRMSLQAVVPLELNLTFDDVKIHGAGTLNRVHLTGIAAGRDLDDGAVALHVDTNRLTMKGTGRLAGIPATIDASMDFRPGPPTQVVQRIAVTARATARALAEAGLDSSGAVAGEVRLNAVVRQFRNGDGDIAVDADLTAAVLTLAPLAWQKPAGTAAKGSARLKLTRDRLTAIEAIALEGTGLRVHGAATATATGGRFDTIRVERAVFGRNDFSGTIRPRSGAPMAIELSGAAIDLAARLQEKAPPKEIGASDPPISASGTFDRVFLAHDRVATGVSFAVESDGTMNRAVSVTGTGGTGRPFSVRIGTENGARRIVASSGDAGDLLAGLGISSTVRGGVLTLSGVFDDSRADHALTGTLEMADYRVIGAPILGRVLQAVTLYGLLDTLGGPGLGFSRLIVPFQTAGDVVILRDARAFSPSLGLTVKGWIDRAAGRLDLEGTVVPAYVFNSLLGRIPFIGGLFTAEKDGGLLAMNYSLYGSMDNPDVMANPLSAVTPGILRGMFQIFDQPAPANPGAEGRKP